MSHDGGYVVIHDKSQLTCDNLIQARARAAELSENVGEDVYRAYMLVDASYVRVTMAKRAEEVGASPLYGDEEFYVCPQHTRTGGYESCCNCGGWEDGAPDYGKLCTEAE